MRRAIKISLKFITESKKRKIRALLESYRAAVNFYIHSLWNENGKLDAATQLRLKSSRLSYNQKGQALKQALSIVVATRNSAKKRKCIVRIPQFTGGAILSVNLVTIEQGNSSFDLMIKLSTLQRGKRIWLPCRKTKVLNKWLARGGTLIQGAALSEDRLILWVKLPDQQPKEQGQVLGCDIGKNKMLTFSDGKMLGDRFSAICDTSARRIAGSKGRRRAIQERKNYINQTLNHLAWNDTQTLVVENLKNLKRGKSKNRSRAFRRKLSPWTYALVLRRMRMKAEENRVRFETVSPAFTSQTCPECSYVDRDNRHDEKFLCLRCGYSADADVVGARNILARYLGSVKSPTTKAVG